MHPSGQFDNISPLASSPHICPRAPSASGQAHAPRQDFADRKDHDSYRKAFDRLLCDLKAEA